VGLSTGRAHGVAYPVAVFTHPVMADTAPGSFGMGGRGIPGTMVFDEPYPAEVVPAGLVLTLESIEPGTTKAHFQLQNAMVPVTYDFGDGLTHVPADANTAHTYAAAGAYTVSVVDAAAATATLEIEVPPVESAPQTEEAEQPAPEPFNPADHTVAEVVDYALGCEPEEVMAIRRAEAAGRNRSTLLAELDSILS
jgi:hypothetical protein